jgi:hypothetical protein
LSRPSADGDLARFSALLSWSREGCLVWSFANFAVRNLFELVWLLARPRRSKELEILVLRHELAMLRRQTRQPKPTRADRALMAALSRSLPRVAWAGFSVKPETLLRWHRQPVTRRWTLAHRAAGREGFQKRGSCCGSVVLVDQSAEKVAAVDCADCRSKDRGGWFGRVKRERAVGAFAVVMGGVGT